MTPILGTKLQHTGFFGNNPMRHFKARLAIINQVGNQGRLNDITSLPSRNNPMRHFKVV